MTLLHHMPGPPVPEQLPVPPHFAADIHFHRANWFLGEKLRVKISIDNSTCAAPVGGYELQLIKQIQASSGPGALGLANNSNHEEVISVVAL